MFKFRVSGKFAKTRAFLTRDRSSLIRAVAERYARRGVDALASATPVDTGLTASSWSYEIESSGDSTVIYWKNSNLVNNVSIAVILQYGHGTRNGGYVQGVDYINPSLRPLFEEIADNAWKEVIQT